MHRALIAAALLTVSAPSFWEAAPVQSSSTISACGSWHTNATSSTACTVAQPGTVGVSGDGQFTHYAGFMGGAFIRPGTTNAQGVALEGDPDNDDDGLTDVSEVSGSAFAGYATTDPNAPDTDRDGMDDAEEAAGMFDPNDPGHRLAILSFTQDSGNLGMTWIGRGGNTTNAILWGAHLPSGEFTNTLHRAAYAGGDFPWFKVTNTHDWAVSGAAGRFYRVQIER